MAGKGYGRPPGFDAERRRQYAEKFHIAQPHMRRKLTHRLLEQLDHCADDTARRLILARTQWEIKAHEHV